jgi:hypothetical protein
VTNKSHVRVIVLVTVLKKDEHPTSILTMKIMSANWLDSIKKFGKE